MNLATVILITLGTVINSFSIMRLARRVSQLEQRYEGAREKHFRTTGVTLP